MKKSYLIALLAFSSCVQTPKMEITEQNYLREDSLLWDQYFVASEKLSALYESETGNRDSLQREMDELLQDTERKNADLALKYGYVPSGLQRMYMVRMDIDKEELRKKMAHLPDSLQGNVYAQYLHAYLETKQLKAGDKFLPFECKTVDGSSFNWKEVEGKHLLLVFDGLYCMGACGRNYLTELLQKVDNRRFDILVYLKCNNQEKLEQNARKFPQLKLITDFKPEGSPMNILYDCQATPTCFLIDEEGKIQSVSLGMQPEEINKYLISKGCL